MAEGVPRERRATLCRDEGTDRRPTDTTVDLQNQITALADAISRESRADRNYPDTKRIVAYQQHMFCATCKAIPDGARQETG